MHRRIVALVLLSLLPSCAHLKIEESRKEIDVVLAKGDAAFAAGDVHEAGFNYRRALDIGLYVKGSMSPEQRARTEVRDCLARHLEQALGCRSGDKCGAWILVKPRRCPPAPEDLSGWHAKAWNKVLKDWLNHFYPPVNSASADRISRLAELLTVENEDHPLTPALLAHIGEVVTWFEKRVAAASEDPVRTQKDADEILAALPDRALTAPLRTRVAAARDVAARAYEARWTAHFSPIEADLAAGRIGPAWSKLETLPSQLVMAARTSELRDRASELVRARAGATEGKYLKALMLKWAAAIDRRRESRDAVGRLLSEGATADSRLTASRAPECSGVGALLPRYPHASLFKEKGPGLDLECTLTERYDVRKRLGTVTTTAPAYETSYTATCPGGATQTGTSLSRGMGSHQCVVTAQTKKSGTTQVNRTQTVYAVRREVLLKVSVRYLPDRTMTSNGLEIANADTVWSKEVESSSEEEGRNELAKLQRIGLANGLAEVLERRTDKALIQMNRTSALDRFREIERSSPPRAKRVEAAAQLAFTFYGDTPPEASKLLEEALRVDGSTLKKILTTY